MDKYTPICIMRKENAPKGSVKAVMDSQSVDIVTDELDYGSSQETTEGINGVRQRSKKIKYRVRPERAAKIFIVLLYTFLNC